MLAGCGGNDSVKGAAPQAPSPSTSLAVETPASQSPTTTATRAPEDEAAFVAGVAASVFAENEEALSRLTVKANTLVESQDEFRFDQPHRTLVLSVTSVFRTGKPTVAYGLATALAPVFWGRQVASAVVRLESLPVLSLTVDGSHFRCDGATMAALADREVSTETFVQRCRV